MGFWIEVRWGLRVWVRVVYVLHDSHGIMPTMDIMEFHGDSTFS